MLKDVIANAKLLKEEKKLKSENLALVLVHDLLLANGIQASDGPLKQAVLRHKTRLHSEFTRAKIRRGVRSNEELAQTGDERAGEMESFDETYTVLTLRNDRPDPTIREGKYKPLDLCRGWEVLQVERI